MNNYSNTLAEAAEEVLSNSSTATAPMSIDSLAQHHEQIMQTTESNNKSSKPLSQEMESQTQILGNTAMLNNQIFQGAAIHALDTPMNTAKPHSFFHKTQSQLEKLIDMSVFDSRILQKGFKFDFIDKNDSPFFEMYVGSTLYFACAYAYILDERVFSKMQAPLLHFSKCHDFQALCRDFVKVCVPKINSFDYRVRSNGVDTRLFYEHPLRICPSCMIFLSQTLSKKYHKEIRVKDIKHAEILNAIFKNTLKNIVL